MPLQSLPESSAKRQNKDWTGAGRNTETKNEGGILFNYKHRMLVSPAKNPNPSNDATTAMQRALAAPAGIETSVLRIRRTTQTKGQMMMV